MATTTANTLARLGMAFCSLEKQGWFTDIGNHWCLTDAVDAVPAGCCYCLVHAQDLECLEEANVIFIAYGSTDPHGGSLDDDALVDVGRQLLHHLERSWDAPAQRTDHTGSQSNG